MSDPGKLSVAIANLEKKITAAAESTDAKFLAQEREEALGKMTICGKGCPLRVAREKLYSIVSEMTLRVLNIKLEPADIKCVTRLNASKKSPILCT